MLKFLGRRPPLWVHQLTLCVLYILPVIGAHLFSFNGSAFTLACAVVSACLWVAMVHAVATNISHTALRFATRIVLVTILSLYFFGQLVSYYLQGRYFNAQYFFHLDITSLTQTWRAYYYLIILFCGWLGCIWLTEWKGRHSAAENQISKVYIPLILILAAAFDPGLRTSTVAAAQLVLEQESIENLDSIDWQGLQLNPDALSATNKSAVPGKNLVLIFLEGFDKIYTDEEVFPGLTPNTQSLNTDGWQWDDFRTMRGTDWTMGGLVSSMCGTPLVNEWKLGPNKIMFTNFLDKAKCLPDILHAAGYSQIFLGGASLRFGGKGSFLSQHKFNRVYGREFLTSRLPDSSYLSGWGLYDDSLFDLALEEFDRLSRQGKPFNLTLLTLDTHFPSGHPSKDCPKYSKVDNSILDAVHCTDYLLGRFIKNLRQHPAYANTLIVTLADHLSMKNVAFPLFPDDYPRRLYFNALNGGIKGSNKTATVSLDVAPTILSLMDVQHNYSFLAGVDITSDINSQRKVNFRSKKKHQTLGFLNSNYLTSSFESKRRSLSNVAEED